MTTRITQEFRNRGFPDKLKVFSGTKLTPQATRYLKTQALSGRSITKMMPRGLALNYDTLRIVKQESLVKQIGKKTKKRKYKLKPSYVKVKPRIVDARGKTADLRRYSGTAKVRLKMPNRYGSGFTYSTKTVQFSKDLRKYEILEQRVKEEIYDELGYDKDRVEGIELTNWETIANLSRGTKPLKLSHMRIKRLKLLIKKFEDVSWDTGKDDCYWDYLVHFVGLNDSIPIESIDAEAQEHFFPNHIKNGISTYEVLEWARFYGITYLSVDIEHNKIHHHQAKNYKGKSLIVMIHNEHLYPVQDRWLKDSITHRFAVKDNSTGANFKEKEKKSEKYNKIFVETDDAVGYIFKLMMETGYEIEQNSIAISNNVYRSFRWGNDKYIFKNDDDVVTECYYSNIENNDDKKPPSVISKEILDSLGIQKSIFNVDTNNIITGNRVPDKAHLGGKLVNTIEDIRETDITIDINKCHRYCLFNPLEEWAICQYADYFKPFNKKNVNKLPLGMYQVNTDDTNLFCLSGLYTRAKVKFGLDRGIIKPKDIKYVLEASSSAPRDTFSIHKMEKLINNYLDPNNEYYNHMKKKIINSISGFLGKTKHKQTTTYLSLSKDEALNYIVKNDDKNPFWSRRKIDDETDGFIYGYTTTTKFQQHHVLMYHQILDHQNIILYKLVEKIAGGDWSKVVYRKADSITFRGISREHIQKFCRDEIGGCHISENPICVFNKEYQHITSSIISSSYNKLDIRTSNDSDKLVKHLDENKSAIIQADPGLGKTHMIFKVQEYYNNKTLNVAYTNCAAIRIKGKTLHRTFSLKEGGVVVTRNIMKQLATEQPKVIIVDEISLLDGPLWGILEVAKEKLKIPILLVGDFWQLPNPNDDTNYLYHPSIMKLADYNIINLEWHDRCRHTKEFYDLLQNIREEGLSDYLHNFKIRSFDKGLPDFNITFDNCLRREINQLKSHEHFDSSKPYIHFDVDFYNDNVVPGKIKDNLVPHFYLQAGMPVNAFVNRVDDGIYNGQRYTITKVEDEQIYIDDLKPISKIEFIKYFSLAYAMTNHKLIGATLEGKYAIHQRDCVEDHRWIYTAISRAKTPNQIILIDE